MDITITAVLETAVPAIALGGSVGAGNTLLNLHRKLAYSDHPFVSDNVTDFETRRFEDEA